MLLHIGRYSRRFALGTSSLVSLVLPSDSDHHPLLAFLHLRTIIILSQLCATKLSAHGIKCVTNNVEKQSRGRC